MNNYKKAGVDIEAGDNASRIAYKYAKTTFASRKGMIGGPATDEGSFAGLIDMRDFYIVQCDDGVGTKIEIANRIGKYDTLGYDLLAMVADDAVCLGAETISISNIIDTNKVDEKIVEELMKGLSRACIEQKVIIPGGEIAELGKSVNGNIWNATAIGVLEKDKVIDGSEIEVGDKIIALKENGFRSNGFSLVRYILEEKYGKYIYEKESLFGRSWGEILLEPSQIYSAELLKILGRFGKPRKIDIKGIAHITGGGIAGNFQRILKNKKLGAKFYDLFPPSEMVKEIQKIGKVTEAEAYKTWNMGNGMMLVVSPNNMENVLEIQNIKAQVAGEIKDSGIIEIQTKGIAPTTLKYK